MALSVTPSELRREWQCASADGRDVHGGLSLSGVDRGQFRQQDQAVVWRVPLSWVVPGFCIEPIVVVNMPSLTLRP